MHYYNISRLHLENFQSIKNPVTLKFAPITLLYGQNSVGKSAIFDAMEVLQKLCKSEFIKHGLIESTFMHDADAIMVIGAGFSSAAPAHFWEDQFKIDLLEVFPSFDSFVTGFDDDSASVEFDIYFHVQGGYIANYVIHIDGCHFATWDADKNTIELSLSNPYMLEIDKRLESDINGSFRQLCESAIDDLTIKNGHLLIESVYVESWLFQHSMFDHYNHPFRADKITSKARQHIELLLSFFLLAPVNTYSEIVHHNIARIGPLRKIPDQSDLFFFMRSDKDNLTFESSVTNWETKWFDGSSAYKYIAVNDKYNNCRLDEESGLLASVNDWLSTPNKLDMQYKLERGLKLIKYEDVSHSTHQPTEQDMLGIYHEAIAEIRLISKTFEDNHLTLKLNNVGSGVSQVIPILVAGFVKHQIHIEQPELHLHPKLQTDLADFFITRWKHDDLISVIETHSEYLALRFLRRIRESNVSDIMPDSLRLDKKDITFYYFDSVNGSTQITELKVSDEGEFIDRWPKGFFSERERELFDEDY